MSLLTQIKRSDTFPYKKSITVDGNRGHISIKTNSWTPQMFYELPSIKFEIYVDNNGVDSKYQPISFILDTYSQSMADVEICSPIINVPESCNILITPLFDNDAISARNQLVLNGIESGTIWDTVTNTFDVDISLI